MRRLLLHRYAILALLVVGMGSLFKDDTHAAEHGTGVYLMGSKGPMAGVVPEPGFYFQNDLFYYRASASASAPLPMGGEVAVGIKARALIDVPTLIWSTPHKVLDGQLAFAVSQPLGREAIDADVVVGSQSGGARGSITTRGDPLVSAMLGWNSGPFHWNTTAMVNVPVGHYRKGSMANLSFNHWAADFSVAVTWFDPSKGWDVSGVAGVTINGRNSATNYRSGHELHLEAAVSKYLSPSFSFGIMGYHYQQITDDTGSGAVLGGFRGRTSALGPTASYSFMLDEKPLAIRVKVLREFNVKNRLKGTAGFLTISRPLS